MESIYSEQQNFRGVSATAMKVDQTLVWKTTHGAKSASRDVSVRVSRKADSYERSTPAECPQPGPSVPRQMVMSR